MPFNPINGQPPSGLRTTFKRDWSQSSTTTQQQVQPSQSTTIASSQENLIEWPKSPPRAPRHKPRVQPKTSYSSDRIAAIQAALDAVKQTSEANLSATPVPPPQSSLSSSSSIPQKRPSDSDSRPANVAKKRTLPWQKDVEVKQEFKRPYSNNEPMKALPKPMKSTFEDSSIAPRVYVAPKREEGEEEQKVPRIFLSNEQQQILKLVEEGNNVFFTGSAGTGKSVLLREIITLLRKKYKTSPDAVAVTASTGIAACNIGGTTLHSFGGFGLDNDTPERLATRVKRNRKSSTRWLRTKVLIIDEISMVEADLFDKLAQIACIMRKNNKVFGGIQLIVCGDFFQLPPVVKGGQVKFAFEAQKWGECIQRTFNLTKVFRQKDQDFVNMLNEMRFGKLTKASIAKFKSLARPVIYEDGIEPTQLFPRREDVERANQERLSRLTGERETYYASDGGAAEEGIRNKQLANLMAPPVLQLCIDAQVMLIKNMEDSSLVNGSIGRVIGFKDASAVEEEEDGKPKKPKSMGAPRKKLPVVRFNVGQKGGTLDMTVTMETWKIETPSGEVQASRSQIPLILAWAMSIHKSQGQTLDRVKVDLNKVFEKGQAYVALSRATSLQGLEVYGFDAAKVQAHPKVAVWSKTLETISNS
ncbi:hypothetical protein M422DRAFT_151421 [Sphaerobolus stellatus SS14]|nr:hypothetical protein M422DRAFT_151421 [Sphaerobolus stellatus SS14]